MNRLGRFLGKTVLMMMLSIPCLDAGLAGVAFPGKQWETAEPAEVGLERSRLEQARDYALTGGGSGCLIRGGKLIMSWGDQRQLYDLKSTTKSFGAAALGLAIRDGKIRLDDKAIRHHPDLGIPPEANRKTGWLERITILHLASQTAGFEKPGGYTPLLFPPGSRWDYSDSGPNWLAECITLAYHQDVDQLMFERMFQPLGIQRTDLIWRNNAYRPDRIDQIKRREFGSGIRANVDAMARFGYLFLRQGQWKEQPILTPAFIDLVRQPHPAGRGLPVLRPEEYGKASDHYGLLWWNNADESLEGVPVDTYWSWGLYDSLIVVMPSLDIVVARAGQSWKREPGWDHYAVLQPFLQPIAASVKPSGSPPSPPGANPTAQMKTPIGQGAPASLSPPPPPSPVIQAIRWAPPETIIRRAPGSDNWPLTWAADGDLYAAYGDGWGFEPKVPEKLSLGLARIAGPPDSFVGTNLRAPSLEQKGDGRAGRKASGLLMVDGILYLWARNAANAQLAWSEDRGLHWRWSAWLFTPSFGCPTFLNFGKNYQGARDDYVYVYSPDSEDAYTPADAMVLARVPKQRLLQREAYEFFMKCDRSGQPLWTHDPNQRGPVFSSPGQCYRSGITYHAGLRRYLWCHILPGGDTRYRGGLAIYDAPEPWGPWTTVQFVEQWDVGPGESASFPSKWISPDGKTLHLVFSGDDCFSVRQASLGFVQE